MSKNEQKIIADEQAKSKNEVADEQLKAKAEELKLKYNLLSIYFCAYEVNGRKLIAWFRTPSVKDFDILLTMEKNNAALQGLKLMAESCFLEGDKELITRDELFIHTSRVMRKMQERKEVELGEF